MKSIPSRSVIASRAEGGAWQSLQPIDYTPIVIPAQAGISRNTSDTPFSSGLSRLTLF